MGARLRALVAAAAAALALALALAAQAGAALHLVRVGDFQEPTFVTAPPGDPHRLFVVEKAGVIRLIEGGAVRADPFLDLPDADVTHDGEQGLLSMAFPPDYAKSGFFYVYYTAPRAGDANGSVITVKEFRRSPVDQDRADPASGRVLLTIDHPTNQNHDGGQLQFGPDGTLYIGTGDGGAGNDPPNNAQNTRSLLGKLLRIAPRPSGTAPYGIPPGNPFASGVSGAREVYDFGLRNPWRFSFDRDNYDLVIADVGQNNYEEIDHARAGTDIGVDYGWRCREGFHATPTLSVPCTPAPPVRDPVFEYPHTGGRCSITGGYVARHSDLGSLVGRYLYGDYCVGDIRSLALGDPNGTDASTGLTLDRLFSFGEDSCGHLYATSGDGTVARIEGDVFTPCPEGLPGGGGGAGGGGGPGSVDDIAPGLGVDRRHVQRLRRHRSLYVGVRCSELCGVRVTGRLSVPGGARVLKLAPVSRTLPAGRRVRVRLRVSRRAARAARRALRDGHRVRAVLTVVARDPAGNQTTKSRRVRVTR
jgi:hypothetical protein